MALKRWRRRRISLVNGLEDQWQADLVDFQRLNRGYNHLLTWIVISVCKGFYENFSISPQTRQVHTIISFTADFALKALVQAWAATSVGAFVLRFCRNISFWSWWGCNICVSIALFVTSWFMRHAVVNHCVFIDECSYNILLILVDRINLYAGNNTRSRLVAMVDRINLYARNNTRSWLVALVDRINTCSFIGYFG